MPESSAWGESKPSDDQQEQFQGDWDDAVQQFV